MSKAVISEYNNKIVSMLIEDNRETRIDAFDKEKASILNNIYVGRVRDLVPNINAAFIEISPGAVCYFSLEENNKPIFLNRKNTDKVCQGDLILVQVKKEALKTKDPVASCNIEVSGRYVVATRTGGCPVSISKKITNSKRAEELKALLLPFAEADFRIIARTDAEAEADETILEEINKLKIEYKSIFSRAAARTAFSLIKEAENEIIKNLWSYRLTIEDELITDLPEVLSSVNSAGFLCKSRLYTDSMLSLNKLYSFETRITNALKSHVWLKSGAYLVIEPTEALTVIDVNTGKYDGRGKDKENTFFKINCEAAEEIARQLVIRNISGIIIADFINMKYNENISLLKRLIIDYLKDDYVKAAFVDFTSLGLAEITRKKVRKSLKEIFNH